MPHDSGCASTRDEADNYYSGRGISEVMPGTESMNAACQYIRSGGERCKAHAIKDSGYCFFHDPSKTADRSAARKAGGRKHRAATLPSATPDRRLATVAEVITLLGETINQVRRGDMDPRVANSAGYLSGLLLKALQQGEVEDRLAALETAVNGSRRGGPSLFNMEPVVPLGAGR
jgi:hypothetical protein